MKVDRTLGKLLIAAKVNVTFYSGCLRVFSLTYYGSAECPTAAQHENILTVLLAFSYSRL